MDQRGEETRIAMWSGPRNISTAMMRSWESRDDTFVTDEPLYAHYLEATRLQHPGREEVLARHESDPEVVIAWLTGPVPRGKCIWYQKHMAHHLLPGMDCDWIHGLTNALLIREPRAMIASLSKFIPTPSIEETGLPQQLELFESMAAHAGSVPIVIDSKDVLLDPPGMLCVLCTSLGVAYDEAMLQWDPGPRETDGVWGRYWYKNVWASTGFARYQERPIDIPRRLAGMARDCDRLYERLYEHRLIARASLGEGSM